MKHSIGDLAVAAVRIVSNSVSAVEGHQVWFRLFAAIALSGLICTTANAQCVTPTTQTATETLCNNPPSNLPANTPATYQLIVPVVGQQETNWCWAATGVMLYEYDDPLPPVQQCEEANASFNQTNCCLSPASTLCNVGDGGPLAAYPFNYFYTPYGTALTWDQLRYQIWVVNYPFAFTWAWACQNCGGHVQVVTGYYRDSLGGEWVYVNNPEPVGVGTPELMSYDEFVADPSSASFYEPHTHGSDGFDTTYLLTRPIYNLATNSTTPTNALTQAQAPNLAGTVISDRVVPFQITGSSFGESFSISGSVLERVVSEAGAQTLDFYYQITNSPNSSGVVTSLTIQDFGRFTAAAAFRPDSSGTTPAQNASRDVSGSTIQINLQPVLSGSSSQLILLMTNALGSNDQGTMTINGLITSAMFLAGSTQIATDQPTN
jgi:hypothetical protein